ncbi:MAG: ThuA domain-containing protein [Pirellulales bacterium]
MSTKTLMFVPLILAWLVVAGAAVEPVETKSLLLIGDQGSHARGAHEHMPGLKILEKCLQGVPHLKVTLVQADGDWPEGNDLIDAADGIVLYLDEGGRWTQQTPKRRESILRLKQRGGGVTALHWATGAKDGRFAPFHQQLIGAVHGGDDRKYIHLDTEVKVVAPDHPITAGLANFRLRDEFYYRLKQTERGKLTPLLEADVQGTPELCCWALERGDGGRSFGFVCLHEHSNWGRKNIRRLVTQGVLWTIDVEPPKNLSLDIVEDDLALPK